MSFAAPSSLAATDHRAVILDALRGQTLRIPDLVATVYAEWHVEKQPNEEQLRRELEGEFASRFVYPILVQALGTNTYSFIQDGAQIIKHARNSGKVTLRK